MKLHPRFVGPFTVVAKKFLAYTLNLPRKMSTHPVFYVDMLESYQDPRHVNVEALQLRESALPQAATSKSRRQAGPSSEAATFPAYAATFLPLPA